MHSQRIVLSTIPANVFFKIFRSVCLNWPTLKYIYCSNAPLCISLICHRNISKYFQLHTHFLIASLLRFFFVFSISYFVLLFLNRSGGVQCGLCELWRISECIFRDIYIYIYVYNTDVFMSAGLAYLWPLVCFGFKLLQAARESIYD